MGSLSINSKKIYDGIYGLLPKKLKVLTSKIVFNVSGKPFYDDAGNINLEKPIICLSADFEMAWAWRFSKRVKDASLIGKIERYNFPYILNKLNELSIPVTWATVGHLFLDSCKKVNGIAHSHIPRPAYFENPFWSFTNGDWYDMDPCTNYKRNPEFYAPDLIELILKSNVNHEIGCHSFSHCDFSEKNSYGDLVKAELSECVTLMKKFGVDPTSFVYPGNQYGNFDLVKKAGFKIIRFKSNPVKEIGFPEILDNNYIAIHDSLDFTSDDNMLGYDYLIKKFKRYINKTIRKKSICHFWFHPSLSQSDLDNLFYPVMNYISGLRDNGIVEIVTMNDIFNTFYNK
jgi:peptidoglycan/xylan/chitin deacetylase (PgdA/CDA1 family)